MSGHVSRDDGRKPANLGLSALASTGRREGRRAKNGLRCIFSGYGVFVKMSRKIHRFDGKRTGT